jgi:hypothetical protein
MERNAKTEQRSQVLTEGASASTEKSTSAGKTKSQKGQEKRRRCIGTTSEPSWQRFIRVNTIDVEDIYVKLS